MLSRVALIFDGLSRPETTGNYCLRALEQLVAVTHFQPSELKTLEPGDFDLFVNIDDGMRYTLPDRLRPAAYWAIDTHIDFDWSLEKSQSFDLVFAAQRDGAEMLANAGISADWMPLACDPTVHHPHPVEKRHEVCFIGNLLGEDRLALLDVLCRQFRCYVDQLYFAEMARAFSESQVVFNRSVKNDVNMRVFEGLACGSLLLTNDLAMNGQTQLFQDGIHLATYSGVDDLIDKLLYYLRRVEVRERIANAGREEVVARHTYSHRMKKLLESAEKALDRTSVAIPEKIPRAGRQNRSYFECARPDVLSLVPIQSVRILDVGCGAGRLGAALKERQGAFVAGIELDRDAARCAERRLDAVVNGSIEELNDNPFGEPFDCIICADILEHLHDPMGVLRRLHNWLLPSGSLVTSIPNAKNFGLIRGLLEGNWTYEPSGLLDQTHLRFFTRLDIELTLYRSGFDLEEVRIVPDPCADEQLGLPDPCRVAGIDTRMIPNAALDDFVAYQYLTRSRPIQRPAHPLTSIVVVTHNELEYTRQCVQSIQGVVDEQYELIFVDNGSSDGTVRYLEQIKDARVIRNESNRGFPAAVNQAMRVCSGENILLLNNDVVLTTGCLRRMLDVLAFDRSVGFVGPLTNCTSGPQRIDVPYRSLGGLESFAWELAKQPGVEWSDTVELTGFCLLMRRAVWESIGDFDERFGVGLYEDVDYVLRGLNAGFRAAIALKAFAHHFGHRTFIGSKIDADALLAQNEQEFAAKWQGSGDAESASRELIRLL